jgi:hypothetical protein
MLLYNIYIAILTFTSEYCGTVTKLQAPFFSGTPLPLYPSSEQHLTTHWGVVEIARVSPCRTQQV